MPKVLAFDIEADELLLKATRIWCIVVQDVNTKQLWKFGPDQIKEGIDLLCTADMLVAHNGIMYDIPVIRILYGTALPKCLDTILVSRLIFPDKFFHPLGANALEDWGRFLKRPKKTYTGGFTQFSQEMMDYCVGDVELLTDIYLWQRKHAFKFKKAIQLEHEVAKIISRQIENGFTLDVDKATALAGTLKKAADILRSKMDELIPPVTTEIVKKAGWSSGQYTFKNIKEAAAFGIKRKDLTQIFQTIKVTDRFNPGSGPQLAGALKNLYGWVPTKFTNKEGTTPSLDEEALSEMDYPLAQLVLEYRTINKRAEFVESWLEFKMEDGRVHGSVITNGAPTGRMSHSEPNMAQVPKVKKGKDKKILMGLDGGFGYECRDCWKARDGWVLVGADASGLELRMLANRMWKYDNGHYAKLVLETDIHVSNKEYTGLDDRDANKTFIYGVVYGAGDALTGKLVNGTAEHGKAIKRRFERKVPAYAKIKREIKEMSAKNHKVLFGLDGRPLPVRADYSALNTWLQSDGAVVMKQSLVCFEEEASKLYAGRYAYCANVHDEFQVECEPEIAEALGKLMVASIRKAGEVLGIKIRLDGEYKIGNTWAETH